MLQSTFLLKDLQAMYNLIKFTIKIKIIGSVVYFLMSFPINLFNVDLFYNKTMSFRLTSMREIFNFMKHIY